MSRVLTFLYGAIAYTVFLASFLYAIAFVGDFLAPRTVNSGLSAPFGQALLINAALLTLFAVQHSVMARPGFKRWWTRIVPEPIERSTYVLASSLILLLLFWQWRPIPAVVWEVEGSLGAAALHALFWAGWLLVLISTFLISHFDLFGLRQVWLALRQRAYTAVPFQTPLLYRFVRHPLLLGFVIAFWATPQMTAGHLLFAVATTGYILVGVRLEERDLVRFHGERYEVYRRRVPMLVPRPGRRADLEEEERPAGVASQPQG